jgi:hypothetical protein
MTAALPTSPVTDDIRLETIAKDIERLQGTAILQMAERLAEAHEIFRYRHDEGGFQGWVERRLTFSRRTAYKLLDAHKQFGGKESVHNMHTFPRSVLYLLAAPSTPEQVRSEVIARASAGEPMNAADIKTTIAKAKDPAVKANITKVKDPVDEAGRLVGNDVDATASAERRKAEAAAAEIETTPVVAPHGKPRRKKGSGMIFREMKLGTDTVNKIKGTSLDQAVEMDELIYLNRGAQPGELTPIVAQLVADAAAGKDVSALTARKRRSHGKPRPEPQSPEPTTNEINAFHQELVQFLDSFTRRFNKWREDDPLVDKDGRQALMQAFYLIADGFAHLAQEFDGR